MYPLPNRPMSPSSTMATAEGLIQSGMNMGATLSDMGMYLGNRPLATGGVSTQDLSVMGIDPRMAATAASSVPPVSVNSGANSAKYDMIDQARGVSDLRGTVPDFGVIAGRQKKYASVNGKLVELDDNVFAGIMNRPNAMAGTYYQMQQMPVDYQPIAPGGNAPQTVMPASPGSAQQPEFKQTPLPEVMPDISRKAKETLKAKALTSTARIATRYNDPGLTPLMVEDWQRMSQYPINNAEGYYA